MSITNKFTAGLVSFAVVFSVVFVPATSVTSAQGIEQLQQQLHALQAQYSALTASSPSSSSVCPYTWTRNLSLGSTGEDVRQLQKFLNGNPQTIVSVSGAGSSGYESTYYGPATARAVSKFQELYAAQILAPLGLTRGTGGFYSSTRNQANSLCRSGTGIQAGPSIQDPVVSVTGDSLVVTAGSQIGDGYAVLGAQRVPYTSFVLTAGNDDVRLEGIRVKKFGLSGAENFETVALVDTRGVQIGSARSLNSRDEARLGSNLVIPRNRSVTLAIVGNIDADGEASGVAGLGIESVSANARVSGAFPIRGAAHVFSEAVDLQSVEISVIDGDSEVHFNEDTEVATFEFKLNASGADEEDAYLRSVTFEQQGSADEKEIGDVTFYVNDEEEDYRLSVIDGDYTVAFDGAGVLIEEGDSVDVSIEVNTDMGTEEDIEFAIDDEADVYVVGASYKYGLPVDFGYVDSTDSSNPVVKFGSFDRSDTNLDERETVAVSRSSVIQSGMISDGGRLRKSEFEEEVRYGRDVVIGAHSVEFEGEDVDMEGLKFEVALGSYGAVSTTESNWKTADEDSITLDNIRLVVDGEVVAYGDLIDSDGDQAEFDEPTAGTTDDIELEIEFDDSFTIDVRDNREVIFEVVANLSRAWAHFDGAEISLTLNSVDMAEGRNSEKDYTASGEYFARSQSFESVEIIGNEISFEITNSGIDDSDFVAGTEDVVFGSFEVDASETVDDIVAKELKVTFEATGAGTPPYVAADLAHLTDCALYDESDDQVADGRSSLTGESGPSAADTATDQMRFRFDSNTVIESGEEVEFAIRCNIDEDALATNKFEISVAANDIFEYLIADDKFDNALAGSSDAITVASSGRLIVTTNHPDDDESLYAQAVGSSGVDDVEVLEIELEAEEEDIRVTDIYLENITVSGVVDPATVKTYLESVIESMRIDLGNTTARPRDYSLEGDLDGDSGTTAEARYVEFDNVNEVIEVGRSGSQTFNLSVDYSGITKSRGRSGAWIDAGNLVLKWEGVTSDADGFTKVSIANDFTEVNVFPTVPTVSSSQRSQTINNTPNEKLYEFTVQASDEGDVYLKQVALEITRGGATLKNVRVRRGTQSSSTVVGSANSDSTATVTGNPKIAFGDAEIIDAGEEVTYSVYAHVEGLVDDKTISVRLLGDSTAPAEASNKIGKAYVASIGNLIWSPDTLDKRGSTTDSSNTDWYSGYAIFNDGDAEWWNSEI